jgi:predicted aconitase
VALKIVRKHTPEEVEEKIHGVATKMMIEAQQSHTESEKLRRKQRERVRGKVYY